MDGALSQPPFFPVKLPHFCLSTLIFLGHLLRCQTHGFAQVLWSPELFNLSII
jgi:hypothetical protein